MNDDFVSRGRGEQSHKRERMKHFPIFHEGKVSKTFLT